MSEYFDLGAYSREITTNSAEAQTWFNRGLNWCYAFHHTEALRCFKKVVEHDPECAMGYWGIAYAVGPYYNIRLDTMPQQMLDYVLGETYEKIRTAKNYSQDCTDLEKALIDALVIRYPVNEAEAEDVDLYAEWNLAYANEMRQIYAQYPEDDDVCALTAESMMMRNPWELWNLETGEPTEGADTLEAIEILEMALNRGEAEGRIPHPGLHHFYIHCMEMSPTPEKALPIGDRLWNMLPDAGHLNHMPSHIYVLCGQYDKTIQSNVDAVVADDKYLEIDQMPGIFTVYHTHNIHFQVYGALFSGQYEEGLRAVNLVEERITEEALRLDSQFLVHFLESLYPVRPHLYVRFGKWDEIIDFPMEFDSEIYAVTIATWHYAKGIAYAVRGDLENAVKQQVLFHEQWERIPEERISYNNVTREVLAVGKEMLSGELEYRRGNYDVAFDHLRQSVYLYDHLSYAEPWTWMQPPRHALGALLLEQGQLEEAAAVYRADLGLDNTLQRSSQHPNNVWALHGYAECCQKLGHDEEYASVKSELERAQAVADIEINASCFCAKVDHCCG